MPNRLGIHVASGKPLKFQSEAAGASVATISLTHDTPRVEHVASCGGTKAVLSTSEDFGGLSVLTFRSNLEARRSRSSGTSVSIASSESTPFCRRGLGCWSIKKRASEALLSEASLSQL
jgi:hypothetical protein